MALTGTETLWVLGQNPYPTTPAASEFQVTTGQIAALGSNFSNDSPTSITTVGNGTLPAAALISGVINRTGPTGNYTDTTDTATNIVAALGGVVGNSFYIYIKNLTAFTQTLTGGTGVTMSVANIVPPNAIAQYLVVISSATAVAFNHVDTGYVEPILLKTTTTLSTVGAGTITGAGIAGGLTVRSGTQSATAFTDTTDTAANIIAAQPNVRIGMSWVYNYQNATNAPATISGGTGVTVSGVTIVQANSTASYVVTYTAANTVTVTGYATNFNPTIGTFTATGASAVTVSNTAASPNSTIVATLKTVGGTVGAVPAVKTITPGTGFTIAGTAADTSVYNYIIFG